LFFASIADKGKTVSLPLSFPLLGSRKKVPGERNQARLKLPSRSLSYIKKVAERIFIAPPIWISCRCNHSLLYKFCIAVHQVDDVGMVLGVLVL